MGIKNALVLKRSRVYWKIICYDPFPPQALGQILKAIFRFANKTEDPRVCVLYLAIFSYDSSRRRQFLPRGR